MSYFEFGNGVGNGVVRQLTSDGEESDWWMARSVGFLLVGEGEEDELLCVCDVECEPCAFDVGEAHLEFPVCDLWGGTGNEPSPRVVSSSGATRRRLHSNTPIYVGQWGGAIGRGYLIWVGA